MFFFSFLIYTNAIPRTIVLFYSFFFDLYLLYLPIVSAGGGMEWTSNMNLNLDLFVELLGPTYLLTT